MKRKVMAVLRSRPWRRLFIDLGDYRRTIVLAGTGRSGTTWIEEVINYAGNFRIMFEPFHSQKVPAVRHWNYRQYLRPGQRAAQFWEPAHQIFSGRIRNAWVDQFNTVHIVRQRIVKDIRANLLLRWIRSEFPEIPIVLLLRHPCAVANSKMTMRWGTHLEDFLSQQELLDDHLRPFVSAIRDASDPFEKYIFMWCIENYVPLRQFSPGEIYVAFYENFCTNPDREARALLAYLNLPFRQDVLQKIGRPSAMSGQWSAVVSGSSMIDAWRKRIEPDQVDRAVEILRVFRLEQIYGSASPPLVTGDEALRVFNSDPNV